MYFLHFLHIFPPPGNQIDYRINFIARLLRNVLLSLPLLHSRFEPVQAVELRLRRGVRDQQAGHYELRVSGRLRADRSSRLRLGRKNLRQSVRNETIRMQEEDHAHGRVLRYMW